MGAPTKAEMHRSSTSELPEGGKVRVMAWPLRATARSGPAAMTMEELYEEVAEGAGGGGGWWSVGDETAVANADIWSRVCESSCSARLHACGWTAPVASGLQAALMSSALEAMPRATWTISAPMLSLT